MNMKKNILSLIFILSIFCFEQKTFGQSVSASQIKKKTNGGLVGDSANALTVGIYRGTIAPSSPVSGQLWQDTTTTPAILKAWNGSAWEIPPTGSANVLTDLSSLPGSPSAGQIVWISSLKRAIVYDSADSAWYYLDASQRRATGDYSLEVAGYSSAFLTAPASAPTLATGAGTSTAGTHVCAVTYFNSTGGETLPGPSSSAVTTTSVQGIAVSNIPIGGAGTAGRRVYCSEAGTTSPLFLAGTISDNSTTTLAIGTATDAAFRLSAPDADFSAPIPSGWTFRAPNSNDLTYGGCGSTGMSLMCAVYAFVAQSASASGVRLTYEILDGSGNWRVTYRLLRASAGFAGHQAMWEYGNVVPYAAASNASDNPESQGVGPWTNNGTDYADAWLAYPIANINRHTRSSGAAWSTSPGAPQQFLTNASLPIWVQYTSDETYLSRWGISTDATNWSTFAALTPSPPTYLPHVGIGFERVGSVSLTTGAVIEFDSFTVEPW